MRAPAYGLGNAPVAFRRPPRNYLLRTMDSPANVGLDSRVSPNDKRSYFVFRKEGGTVGGFATCLGETLGYGQQDAPSKIRVFSEYRFGAMKVQKSPFVHDGVELSHGCDFSEQLIQEEFTKNLESLVTSPGLWDARLRTLSREAIR